MIKAEEIYHLARALAPFALEKTGPNPRAQGPGHNREKRARNKERRQAIKRQRRRGKHG